MIEDVPPFIGWNLFEHRSQGTPNGGPGRLTGYPDGLCRLKQLRHHRRRRRTEVRRPGVPGNQTDMKMRLHGLDNVKTGDLRFNGRRIGLGSDIAVEQHAFPFRHDVDVEGSAA